MTEQQKQAYEDYKAGMKYKDIAAKYGVTESAVKTWKRRYWSQKVADEDKKLQPSTKKVAKVAKSKKLLGNRNAVGHGAPKGNKNALGNRGGHAPPRNQNAVRHGLYAKYLPSETLEIAESISSISPIDLLWDNICIKYASILRAQKLMYVDNSEDFTKRTVTDGVEITGYSYQEAWDKHASFLRAQAAAMKALTAMIKEYEELCKSELLTQEQQLRVDKLKAEVNTMKSESDNEKITIIDDIE